MMENVIKTEWCFSWFYSVSKYACFKLGFNWWLLLPWVDTLVNDQNCKGIHKFQFKSHVFSCIIRALKSKTLLFSNQSITCGAVTKTCRACFVYNIFYLIWEYSSLQTLESMAFSYYDYMIILINLTPYNNP